MPDFDPDTEDRRPDRDREEDPRSLFDDDDMFDEAGDGDLSFEDRDELALEDLRFDD